jgi:hypothetical protein
MLSRFAAPVANFLKKQTPKPAPGGVPELLAALEAVRARRADLEREEREIIAATQARLREQQEALAELQRRVHDCGIAVGAAPTTPSAQAVSPPEDSALRPSQPVLLNN